MRYKEKSVQESSKLRCCKCMRYYTVMQPLAPAEDNPLAASQEAQLHSLQVIFTLQN